MYTDDADSWLTVSLNCDERLAVTGLLDAVGLSLVPTGKSLDDVSDNISVPILLVLILDPCEAVLGCEDMMTVV